MGGNVCHAQLNKREFIPVEPDQQKQAGSEEVEVIPAATNCNLNGLL